MTRETILLSAFVAVEGAHAFSAFNPSIFTIRTFGAEDGTVKSIRDGEMLGVLFAVVLGFIVSALTGTWLPLLFAALTSAFMVAVYEWALRS